MWTKLHKQRKPKATANIVTMTLILVCLSSVHSVSNMSLLVTGVVFVTDRHSACLQGSVRCHMLLYRPLLKPHHAAKWHLTSLSRVCNFRTTKHWRNPSFFEGGMIKDRHKQTYPPLRSTNPHKLRVIHLHTSATPKSCICRGCKGSDECD